MISRIRRSRENGDTGSERERRVVGDGESYGHRYMIGVLLPDPALRLASVVTTDTSSPVRASTTLTVKRVLRLAPPQDRPKRAHRGREAPSDDRGQAGGPRRFHRRARPGQEIDWGVRRNAPRAADRGFAKLDFACGVLSRPGARIPLEARPAAACGARTSV